MPNYSAEIAKIQKILDQDYNHEQPDIPRSKDFTRAVAHLLRKLFPGCIVKTASVTTSPSYVLSKEGKYIYVSIPDYRWEVWYTHILYRTMAHEKDWTGDANHFTHICDIEENVNALFRWN